LWVLVKLSHGLIGPLDRLEAELAGANSLEAFGALIAVGE
jgi:hypothetical protein